jgi:hypothetical protein
LKTNSKIVDAMGLWDYKLWRRGRLQWHYLLAEFHKNEQIDSKVNSGGGGTHRRTDRWSHEPPFHL